MLHELRIKNFAIIDELNLSFEKGLNILTGETGAGKSIIIGAVGLLLGDRVTADVIRSQSETASVEAIFDISDDDRLKQVVADMGFPAEDDEFIIRRLISRSGKNRAFINGRAATLYNLGTVSERLINICGQHEHQIILNTDNHLDILDEFGNLLSERDSYFVLYSEYQRLKEKIDALHQLRSRREEKTEWLKFQLQEIQEINPQPHEDITLNDEKKVLVNFQKISDGLQHAYDLLYGDRDSIISKLKEVQNQVKEIKKIDVHFNLSDSDIEEAFITLQDAALILRDYGKSLCFDAVRLAAIDERLELINKLKRKHGGSLERVLSKKQEIEEELRMASAVEEELEKVEAERKIIIEKLKQSAERLSALRKKAAKKLQESVEIEIHALNMPHASFDVHFRDTDSVDSYGSQGMDNVEFYLAANQGEDAKPLNRIASGGELSRIILALKNVLSRTGSVSTMVFDEVDNGIGGAVAEIVGRKLKEVSVNHQVICITHLPQIACYADKHMYVSKKTMGGRTVTAVEEIEGESQIEEISRMLGGVEVTKTTRDHAREMIANARSLARKEGVENVEKSTRG